MASEGNDEKQADEPVSLWPDLTGLIPPPERLRQIREAHDERQRLIASHNLKVEETIATLRGMPGIKYVSEVCGFDLDLFAIRCYADTEEIATKLKEGLPTREPDGDCKNSSSIAHIINGVEVFIKVEDPLLLHSDITAEREVFITEFREHFKDAEHPPQWEHGMEFSHHEKQTEPPDKRAFRHARYCAASRMKRDPDEIARAVEEGYEPYELPVRVESRIIKEIRTRQVVSYRSMEGPEDLKEGNNASTQHDHPE
jgi:hypothetical protein